MAAVLILTSDALSSAGPTWRVARAEVHVVCPLTVGGVFEARTAALTGTLALATARPAAFEGDLVVDLRTLESGIALRDEHLRGYLEVGGDGRYDAATLSDLRLDEADAEKVSGRTPFSGRLQLRGVTKPVHGQAKIRRDGPRIRVEAVFPVRLSDHGIRKPQYLGVGVKDEVQIKVTLTAEAVTEPAAR